MNVSRNSGEYNSVVSMPYVRSSVAATMDWCKRNATLVQKVFDVLNALPDFADMVLDYGYTRLNELNRYAPWIEDYNRCLVHGFPGEKVNDFIRMPSGEILETVKIIAEVC